MIIARITGGLGNQLFQYAAGLALAERLGSELKLDLSFYKNHGLRTVELDQFNTRITEASEEECAPFVQQHLLKRVFYRLVPPYRRPVYKQPGFGYDPFFEKAKDGKYLKGYWQSWKFFHPIEEQIRRQYQLKPASTEHLREMADTFRTEKTISVHIRRGDYKNPEALAYHGILSPSYYNQALKRMQQLHPDAQVLFFSDDMDWVLQNIQTEMPHRFITNIITRNAIEDFYLMQHCQHHIIANSSFSWWAAWLNPSAEKTVIAPQSWFAYGGNETRDILPPSWIRI